MASYRFVTEWRLDAPVRRVWDVLYAVERWPSWWEGVERTRELEAGEPGGVGKLFEIAWRSVLPYELAFEIRVTRVEEPSLMEGEAHGELEGTGRWRLTADDGGTLVVYEWDVRTTKRWMNLLGPLARPAFAWNHDRVMATGLRGLRRVLSVGAH